MFPVLELDYYSLRTETLCYSTLESLLPSLHKTIYADIYQVNVGRWNKYMDQVPEPPPSLTVILRKSCKGQNLDPLENLP